MFQVPSVQGPVLPIRLAHFTEGEQVTFEAYQVPVYAAEEGVGLDIGKPSLWPAAEPLFGILGVQNSNEGESGLLRKPLIQLQPNWMTQLPPRELNVPRCSCDQLGLTFPLSGFLSR